MKTDNLVSLRAAARELHIDRATLGRLVAERGVPEAGRRAGHSVFDLEVLRRVVDLEWYGYVRQAVPATCDECWGFLHHHRDGKACPKGAWARGEIG